VAWGWQFAVTSFENYGSITKIMGQLLFARSTMLDELERRDLRIGLVAMCAAAGMALAIIIERTGM
jgi:hypothetical protein